MWKAIGIILFLAFLLKLSNGLTGRDFVQEHAKVVYVNPKYLTDVHVKTTQTKRKVFETNITATLLHPWGNNITGVLVYENIKVLNSKTRIDLKVCDCFKQKWLKETIMRSSDIKSFCPISAGTVHFYDMELPPPDFPLPIPAGEYHVTILYIITKTKETVVEFEIVLKSINTKYNSRRSSKDG